jgi:hypothetical protein
VLECKGSVGVYYPLAMYRPGAYRYRILPKFQEYRIFAVKMDCNIFWKFSKNFDCGGVVFQHLTVAV